MEQPLNMLVRGKYGVIKKEILELNFPQIFNELEKMYSKYYLSPNEIKINNYLELEHGFSICTDPSENDEKLYQSRVTIHHLDPTKTIILYDPNFLDLMNAQIKATFLALEYLENQLKKRE